jgi:hypothetical protein
MILGAVFGLIFMTASFEGRGLVVCNFLRVCWRCPAHTEDSCLYWRLPAEPPRSSRISGAMALQRAAQVLLKCTSIT